MKPVSPEITALFFGGDCDPALWAHWRDRTEGPHTSWYAHWRLDCSLSAREAHNRATAARKARVTERTGASWAEREKDSGEWLVFLLSENEQTTKGN
jgi:hypothetical protein